MDDAQLEREIRRIEADIGDLAARAGLNPDELKATIRNRGGYEVDMNAYRKSLAESFAAALVGEEKSKALRRKA